MEKNVPPEDPKQQVAEVGPGIRRLTRILIGPGMFCFAQRLGFTGRARGARRSGLVALPTSSLCTVVGARQRCSPPPVAQPGWTSSSRG